MVGQSAEVLESIGHHAQVTNVIGDGFLVVFSVGAVVMAILADHFIAQAVCFKACEIDRIEAHVDGGVDGGTEDCGAAGGAAQIRVRPKAPGGAEFVIDEKHILCITGGEVSEAGVREIVH